MKKNKFLIACCVVFFSLQAYSNAPKAKKKPTVYDFNEVDITGSLKKPEGASIKERPATYFKRLFKLKEDFKKKIQLAVEDY